MRSQGRSARRAAGSALRYPVAILGGFAIDLSIAWVSHEVFGIDLVAAAALGFVVATTISYFAHEFWTFRRASSALSGRRFIKFVLASGATLATRLALVWPTGLLTFLLGGALVRLILAYGGSLIVGFVVNRGVVFTDEEQGELPKPGPS